MVFFSSHVWMWELDYKEGWVPKNWCFWTVVLKKTLESPLDCKEITPVNPKWNQSWIFIGKTDAEAEAPILWLPDVKSQLTRKDPDAGKDWGQEEKGMTEDEIVGWHHPLNGHEFEQTPGDCEGQGSLACSSPWGRKSQTRVSNWKTTNSLVSISFLWLSAQAYRPPEWQPTSLKDGLWTSIVSSVPFHSLPFLLTTSTYTANLRADVQNVWVFECDIRRKAWVSLLPIGEILTWKTLMLSAVVFLLCWNKPVSLQKKR